MEEIYPDNAQLLPQYIIQKIDDYTERECRNICREIVFRVYQFHEGGVVHRKLHMHSVVVESQVRLLLSMAEAVTTNSISHGV
mgnify:CR=1 FL=1